MNRSEYGVFRMPANGSAFSNIEEKWPNFKTKHRNLMISLVADGVNQFGELITTYLVWLVFVIKNIIPLWKSIKGEHIVLTMIVPGINLFRIFFFST